MGAADSPPRVQRAQGARTQAAPRRSEVPRWAQGGGLTRNRHTRGAAASQPRHARPCKVVQADAWGPPIAHHMYSGRRARAHREHAALRWAQGTRGNGDKRLAISLTAGETLLCHKVDGTMMHVF